MTARPASILVAEDSLVIRAVVRRHLEAQGYAVLEAEDGRAALERCRKERPDVLLLDVEMPVLDGYGVLKALKADPELSLIPVVFLYLEVLFGFIQALVFAILTLIYISLAAADVHDDHVEESFEQESGVRAHHAVEAASGD